MIKPHYKYRIISGYFLADNLAVGLSAMLSSKATSSGVSVSTDAMTYGALLRYYIGGVAYVEGGYGLRSNNPIFDDLILKLTSSDMYGKVGAAIFN